MKIFKQGGKGSIGAVAIILYLYLLFLLPFWLVVFVGILAFVYEYYYHAGAYFGVLEAEFVVFKRLGFYKKERHFFLWADILRIEISEEGYKEPRKITIHLRNNKEQSFEYQEFRRLKQAEFFKMLKSHVDFSVKTPEILILRNRRGFDVALVMVLLFAFSMKSIYFAFFISAISYFLHLHFGRCYFGIGKEQFIGRYPYRLFGQKEMIIDWAHIKSVEVRKHPRSINLHLQSGGVESFYYKSYGIKKQKRFFDLIREHVPLTVKQAVGL